MTADWHERPALSLVLMLWCFLKDLTDREVLVLWEGSAMDQATRMLLPMFEHGFREHGSEAVAHEQATCCSMACERRGCTAEPRLGSAGYLRPGTSIRAQWPCRLQLGAAGDEISILGPAVARCSYATGRWRMGRTPGREARRSEAMARSDRCAARDFTQCHHGETRFGCHRTAHSQTPWPM